MLATINNPIKAAAIIAAPKSTVYMACLTVEKYPQWLPLITKIKTLKPENQTLKIGEKFIQTHKITKDETHNEITLTKCLKNKQLQFLIKSLNPTQANEQYKFQYNFLDAGKNKCKIIAAIQLKTKREDKNLLVIALQQTLTEFLQHLKNYCEK